MRIEDVVALAKAGFNVNQISEMNKQMMSQQMPVQQMPAQQMPAQQMPAQQMPVQQMPVQQMPVQQMPAQQMPAQQMPAQQMPVQGDAYMQKLNEILSGVQMSAINNTQIMNPPETADDILAHIINPKEQEVK